MQHILCCASQHLPQEGPADNDNDNAQGIHPNPPEPQSLHHDSPATFNYNPWGEGGEVAAWGGMWGEVLEDSL